MSLDNTRIVFLYPSKKIGGAQLLFSRLADSLYNNVKIGNIDEGTSFISDYLKEKKIPYDHLIKGKKLLLLKEKDVLICPLSFIFIYRNFIDENSSCKIIFWDLHPYNLIENTAYSFLYKKKKIILTNFFKLFEISRFRKINQIIHDCQENNSILFMCKSNYEFNSKFFDIPTPIKYLQIAAPSIEKKEKNKKEYNDANINIGWISRIDPDKIHILNLLIEDCISYIDKNPTIQITLHIVGDGSSVKEVKNNKRLNLKMPGRLDGLELSDYIYTYIDIGFSMGTSVLEFGARKISSVVVPTPASYNFYKKKSNRYAFLYDITEYDITVETYTNKDRVLTFQKVIEEYINNSEKIAEKCFQHVLKNHNLSNVSKKLLELANLSTLEVNHLTLKNYYNNSKLESINILLKKLVKLYAKKYK